MINDEFYMSLAIKKAWEFQILTYPNPAVGCVILDAGGRLLSVAAHKKAGFLHAEPSAVLLALCKKSEAFLRDFLREYNAASGIKFESAAELENADLQPNFTYEYILQNHGDLLKGAKAYVTLEPCAHRGKTPPCVELLRRLKFAKVVIARGDENAVASGGAHILQSGGVAVKFDVLRQQVDDLVEPFLAWQRGNFSFFKLALSANGVAVGTAQSKIISNLASRTYSHRLRSAAELLVIGGATVRADRPRLDTRLIEGGKNPNVMIYSREREFDASIPLFGVEGRSVRVSSDINEAFVPRLTMFEGGENALKALDERVKWLLLYRSSELLDAPAVRLNLKLKPLFHGELDGDVYGWYRIERSL